MIRCTNHPNPSLWVVIAALVCLLGLFMPHFDQAFAQRAIDDLTFLGEIKDRSAGTPGSESAADYLLKAFEEAGLSDIGEQKFFVPVPEVRSASIEVEGSSLELYPWGPNLVYLSMTPPEGLTGPLLYAGDGELSRFDGRAVKDSIVLMDMASYGHWMNAAMLGARALIFLGNERSIHGEFEEKNIPTPLAFPRFWVSPETGEKLKRLAIERAPHAVVKSRAQWQHKLVRNCYGFVPGKDPKLKNELIVLDAFYDASSHILGLAPGADEATSVAMLLQIARELAQNPPERSVLFLATTGNGQALAGMRQFIWSITTRQKLLRKEGKQLDERRDNVEQLIRILGETDPLAVAEPKDRALLLSHLVEKAKDRADVLARTLQYEKALGEKASDPIALEEARKFRRLSWLTSLDDLSADQKAASVELLKETLPTLNTMRKELKLRREVLKSNDALRKRLDDYTPILFMSLQLSSHSPRLGLVEMGETYPVQENVRRMIRASRLGILMDQTGSDVAMEKGLPSLIGRTPQESVQGAGKSHTNAHPCCDVGALAGLSSVALVSLDNNHALWSTPYDTLDRIDRNGIDQLSRFLPPFFRKLFSQPGLQEACEQGVAGLASLEGRAMFIRQGELFPDQPAPDTIISVLQGDSVFRTMVYQDGTFFLPGLANKRVAMEKLIIEPYGLDKETGRVAWTADKVQTGKENYRIKVKSDLASTSLVMFRCMQTDVLRVFNPQKLGYLTKVELFDTSTEATPLRYWYSRVDGRDTMAISVCLEKGTRFKLIMSETLLGKELFLLNSSAEEPTGKGFLIGEPATLAMAPQQVAQDLYHLLGSRLRNLFQHGIVNHHLESLYSSAGEELEQSRRDLDQGRYGLLWSRITSAWAKLNIIYGEIEGTQRDVLGGVMFFVALFVPFAYCMERYLFGFRGIYQQIAAFFLILILTILVIRALHPAFQLTYSPMVVIIAFFIVGLSLLVSWIIFMRFETEMSEVHNRASHLKAPHTSKWQAFGAGFSIGVSNLNRRKLRTGLTCATLIILTFTVMSFTNVKTLHRTTSTRLADDAAYRGILLRHQYRLPLTLLTLEDMRSRLSADAVLWPRAWVDPPAPGQYELAGIRKADRYAPFEGVLGLGSRPPQALQQIITSGRWFQDGERDVVLLSLSMAGTLGLNPEQDVGAVIDFMGSPLKVVGFFDGSLLESFKDLDRNPITPAYHEVSQSEQLTEVEIEAMQSGEELLPQTERFRYASAHRTILVPFERCIHYGGTLKAVTILPVESPMALADQLATWLAFPLFVGEDGTWYHSAGNTLRYQGAANLIVPILIVIFITLNTMIGHVHERQREIGTYTSVGLAPTHVGFLFIVEALSMAVISTVIGYILAQLSAKYLGNTALFSQLTFNYSSLASVACMFLVFSVVFLAALYPARVAAEIAMPDVNRSWTLPEPDGDTIVMNLPFLLKYEEEKGVIGFLNAFYRSYQDVAHGTFIVDETRLELDVPPADFSETSAQACLLIRTNVWLAPFDFGIKQALQLYCCPSLDNPGYLEIALRMTRLSGERSAWIRANKNFIKALRKQMLLWRLLDQESKTVFSDQCSIFSARCPAPDTQPVV